MKIAIFILIFLFLPLTILGNNFPDTAITLSKEFLKYAFVMTPYCCSYQRTYIYDDVTSFFHRLEFFEFMDKHKRGWQQFMDFYG